MNTEQETIEITAEVLETAANQLKSNLPINTPITRKLQEISKAYLELQVTDPDDAGQVAAVHAARMVVKNTRVAIENRRKDLVADAVVHQRNVNTAAKQLTAIIASTEEHLEYQEAAPERAQEERRQAQLKAEEERIRRQQEEELARKAEEQRQAIAAEEQAARERLEADRKQQEQEMAARQAEQAERAREQQEAAERLLQQQQEQEAKEAELRAKEERLAQAERDRLEWQERIAKEQQEIKAERRRLEQQQLEQSDKRETPGSWVAGRIAAEEEERQAMRLGTVPEAAQAIMDEAEERELADHQLRRQEEMVARHIADQEAPLYTEEQIASDKEKLDHRLELIRDQLEDMEVLNTDEARDIWQDTFNGIMAVTSGAIQRVNNL